jgi:hypothetical protein
MPKSANTKKIKKYMLKVSDADWEIIEQGAKHCGITRKDWILAMCKIGHEEIGKSGAHAPADIQKKLRSIAMVSDADLYLLWKIKFLLDGYESLSQGALEAALFFSIRNRDKAKKIRADLKKLLKTVSSEWEKL